MKDASQCDIPNCRTSSPGRTHAFYGTGCASRYLSNHPCNSYCTAKDARDIKNKVTSDTSIAICLLYVLTFRFVICDCVCSSGKGMLLLSFRSWVHIFG